MPKRQAIFDAIDRERDRQDTDKPEEPPTIIAELFQIDELVSLAVSIVDPETELNLVRQIGAVAVRCQENHGLVERTR